MNKQKFLSNKKRASNLQKAILVVLVWGGEQGVD